MHPQSLNCILGARRLEPAHTPEEEGVNQLLQPDRQHKCRRKRVLNLLPHPQAHPIPSCEKSSGQIREGVPGTSHWHCRSRRPWPTRASLSRGPSQKTKAARLCDTCCDKPRYRFSFLPKSRNDNSRPGFQSTSSITMESGRISLGRRLADKRVASADDKNAEWL